MNQVFPTPVELTEKSRVYIFPTGEVRISKPRELFVSDSGNHRIQTEDGMLHIVAPGWLAIHIDDNGNGWTV